MGPGVGAGASGRARVQQLIWRRAQAEKRLAACQYTLDHRQDACTTGMFYLKLWIGREMVGYGADGRLGVFLKYYGRA
jgi:hypothetical protein